MSGASLGYLSKIRALGVICRNDAGEDALKPIVNFDANEVVVFV